MAILYLNHSIYLLHHSIILLFRSLLFPITLSPYFPIPLSLDRPISSVRYLLSFTWSPIKNEKGAFQG
jgi:hypothetical protein